VKINILQTLSNERTENHYLTKKLSFFYNSTT